MPQEVFIRTISNAGAVKKGALRPSMDQHNAQNVPKAPTKTMRVNPTVIDAQRASPPRIQDPSPVETATVRGPDVKSDETG
jgi:hypothetical protein